MFSASAEFYDAVYGAFKDFAGEASVVAELIREQSPSAHSILDVGCGTAEHAKHLSQRFGYEVDGLDLDPGLLSVAKTKLPAAKFFEANMSNFQLGRRYDVILCLFSSIGYVRTLDEVCSTLACFRRHLEPNGLVIVEPWFEPGVLRPGAGPDRFAQIGELEVKRQAFTRVEGNTSTLEFTYFIKERVELRTIREEHRLELFTRAEMEQCFSSAGLLVQYQTPGLTGRGLYLARSAPVEPEVTVRHAVTSDVDAIANVHVAAWRKAYLGLIPDVILDSLSEQKRAVLWRGLLSNPDHQLLVAEVDTQVVGFCSLIPSRDEDAHAGIAEIAAIYLAPSRWRSGIGTVLLDTALTRARSQGYQAVTLWALASNDRARRFYERCGFTLDGTTKVVAFEGCSLLDVRFRKELG